MNTENNTLYDWVFRFNTMDSCWYATKRDNFNDFYSNIKSDKLLKSKNINTLVEIINKTDGDIKKINKLLNKPK